MRLAADQRRDGRQFWQESDCESEGGVKHSVTQLPACPWRSSRGLGLARTAAAGDEPAGGAEKANFSRGEKLCDSGARAIVSKKQTSGRRGGDALAKQ